MFINISWEKKHPQNDSDWGWLGLFRHCHSVAPRCFLLRFHCSPSRYRLLFGILTGSVERTGRDSTVIELCLFDELHWKRVRLDSRPYLHFFSRSAFAVVLGWPPTNLMSVLCRKTDTICRFLSVFFLPTKTDTDILRIRHRCRFFVGFVSVFCRFVSVLCRSESRKYFFSRFQTVFFDHFGQRPGLFHDSGPFGQVWTTPRPFFTIPAFSSAFLLTTSFNFSILKTDKKPTKNRQKTDKPVFFISSTQKNRQTRHRFWCVGGHPSPKVKEIYSLSRSEPKAEEKHFPSFL